ncbi:G5 domain-containing protein, partial [Streptococcus oralis]|uniref:SIALI-17 repeat-containing surface protein n=1 Tax=Streptococcus oralis TaxID=1303 RepID=UPI001D1501C1
MKHQFYGEKRQRFSFRKLSVGLVSATIGSFFLSGQITGDLTSVKAAEIQSQQSAQVKYHYVVESELTEAEKSALIREIPKYVEDASETYYLVYRPTTQGDSSGVLPKTGHSGLWESTFTAMGLALLVLVVVRGRNGKRYLSSILLVTGMGSMLLFPTVLAVTNIELAAYNQSLNLGLGDELPAPLKIDGYDYIGYLKNEEQNDSHLAHSALKENPTLDLEKEKGSELKPNETNLDMKEIVSDKGDALTEGEREAIAAKERESARLSPVYDLPELKISEQESVQELPYQTKYQYTDELAQGQSKVIQSGVRGQRTVVTRHFRKDQEIVKSEMISDQVTVEPVSEIILVGTAPTNSIPKETPVHEVPKLSEYGTTPETAPVHEVPELTEYGTTPETAPVHEVPELTEYGTTPEIAPVHEVPELTEYGTSPETTPVHEVSELKEYGTNPDTAPVHEVPELTEYGTTPETAPVHEASELTEYGTSPETTPVQEIPELAEYGTTPETAPVHEVPELAEYGTNPESSPVHEVPELTEYGTTPETAPVHEVPELTEYGTSSDTPPVQEIPELTEYGTTPDTAPIHENSELELTTNDEVRIEKIDFSIDEQYTDEIPEGSRQIATPGVEGERTIKTRVYSSNGQVVDRQELSNEETLAPVTQIVKVGTAKPNMVPSDAPKAEALPEYPLTYTDETRVEKIAFNIEEQHTDELVRDARQIATPGVQGERTIKTRVYSSNGQEVDRQELSNEETLAPVTQIVKVGTAKPTMVPNEAPKADALPEYPLTYTDETRVEKINFTIREEETDELVQDARQIVIPGVQGERTIKTRVYSSNGQVVDRQELSDEETLAPVTQIVKVGTAKPTMVPNDAPKTDDLPEYPLTYTDETRVEKINFSIREEETDELVQDARQIATPGVQGERTIKTRVYSSNGQEIDRQELSNEETLASITQIVKVGTAKPTMVPNEAPKA